MTFGPVVERFLRHDRQVVLASLMAVTVIAWGYLITVAGRMDDTMAGGLSSMAQFRPWTAVDAGLMFVMWVVMMIGMMTPSATPMILLYARVCRKHNLDGGMLAPTWAFFAGYVTVWAGFSVIATTLQGGLEWAALLSPMMKSANPLLSGVVLMAAGLYQLTPYRHTCLRRCRSPVEFLSTHWRHGTWGAFVMGLEHGGFCVGCCWALMVLLFVGGVMNLVWVAAITVFVLVEKVTRFGRAVGQAGALLLVAWGIWSIRLSVAHLVPPVG
jgi:predicted metal-binding membrane protein